MYGLTHSAVWRRKARRGPALIGWTVGVTAVVVAAQPAWPPFLPGRDRISPDIAAAGEHVWNQPTLQRSVRGPTVAAVPVGLYEAFIDAPDITAAAARHLGLARHEVRAVDTDTYEASDRDGARGRYRILVREPGHRVILSWGEHAGGLLGTVSGSALTELHFAARGGGVEQQLSAYVRIDDKLTARLARLLVPFLGFIADRKLAEGLVLCAQAASWAAARPDQFRAWLGTQPISQERRDVMLRQLREPARAAAAGAS
jgi:hypothetical protein